MKYLFINVLFIFLCQTICLSQKASFSVSGNVYYTSELSNRFNHSRQFGPNKEINSIKVLRLERRLTNAYNSNVGYELLPRVKFRMGKRFRFSSGIGLNYLNFKVNSSNEIMITAYGTSSASSSNSNLNFSTPCEGFYHFTSSRQNETRLDGGFRILNGKVPVELSYALFDEKLELGIGLFLQVPIYSRSINQIADLNYREVDGDMLCESEIHEEIELNNNGINRNQIGSIFNISYKLHKNILVNFGLVDYIFGVFEKSESYQNSQDRYSPTSLFFGLECKL